jgi:methionyl aminopeptidase
MPFPKSLCTSVNEVICHGIPDSTVLKDGDIVNCDVTIYLDGVHGDTNATFLVGDVSEQDRAGRGDARVPRRRHRGRPPRRAHPRHRQGHPDHAEGHGYGVIRAFVGHGVGRSFHSDPQVFHYDNPSAKGEILPG